MAYLPAFQKAFGRPAVPVSLVHLSLAFSRVITETASLCASRPSRATMRFPKVRGRAATGEQVTLPADFGGDPTLVLMAFRWQQRGLIESWESFAAHLSDDYPAFEYCELVLVNRNGGMIGGGLARQSMPEFLGLPAMLTRDLPDHAVVAPVDKRRFRRSLGLVGEQTNYALLVDDGRVVRGAAGALTDDVARELDSLLGEWEHRRRDASDGNDADDSA